MTIATGVHSTIERVEYDGIAALNFSRLKRMAHSPARYKHGLQFQADDTTAKKFGRASHLAVLEPERFASDVAVWTGKVRRGKEWDAFELANVGKELLTADEHEECCAIAASVKAHPIASKLLSEGRPEATVIAKINGVQCKARLDWLSAGGIPDLKTTTDVSQEAFGRDALKYHYAAQAAFYTDIVYAATGDLLPFRVIAVEKSAPYLVAVYRVPEKVLAFGRVQYRAWMAHVAQCEADNHWPGPVEGETDLVLPRWAGVDDSDDESEAA